MIFLVLTFPSRHGTRSYSPETSYSPILVKHWVIASLYSVSIKQILPTFLNHLVRLFLWRREAGEQYVVHLAEYSFTLP